MTKQDEAGKVLSTCFAVERACGRLYRRLADIHGDDQEIANLWRKTAREEDSHAAQFRLASENLPALVESANIGLPETAELLEAVETVFSQYGEEPPGIVEGLATALRLEERLARLHMDQIANFTTPSFKALFSAMMSADREHIARISAALASRQQR